MPARAIRRGMPPKRVPMVSTGSDSAQVGERRDHDRDQDAGPVSAAAFASTTMMAMLTAATATAETLAVCSPRASASSFGINSPGSLPVSVMPKQIPELAGEDDDGDAGGESHRHRIGNEFDVGAEPQKARGDQKHAGHRGGEDHAVDAVAFGGQRHQHDERAGGPADLKPAAAEQRDDEAADHGGIKPAIRRHARGDRDRHRQRQRHDRHRQAGDHVGAKIRKAIAFAQHRDQLRRI